MRSQQMAAHKIKMARKRREREDRYYGTDHRRRIMANLGRKHPNYGCTPAEDYLRKIPARQSQGE